MEAPKGSRSAPRFKPGFNLFSPKQDVELGRQSAQQIMNETPMLKDPIVVEYIRELGAKLASKAAGEKFPYQFNVVATREINAFALPGGYLFVNAGVIAAAKNEGELAGVISHEIAHAALRHGTNQATKQRIAQVGIGILGSITSEGGGTNTDEAINAIGGFGANLLFLKFGRGAEKEADLEGARIMAEAGYDPRDMASFFKTLNSAGGQRIPEMLSDHPDPGNRTNYILQEIPRLSVISSPVRASKGFNAVKARITKIQNLSNSSQLKRIGNDPNNLELNARPAPPSSSFNQFEPENQSFSIQIPSNWNNVKDSESNFIFAPKGAYGKMPNSQNTQGIMMVTHGIFVGVISIGGRDLHSATVDFIKQQIEANPDFKINYIPQIKNIGERQGYVTVISGPSAINGVAEIDTTYTFETQDGRMFYLITITPQDEATQYQQAFQRILASLKF